MDEWSGMLRTAGLLGVPKGDPLAKGGGFREEWTAQPDEPEEAKGGPTIYRGGRVAPDARSATLEEIDVDVTMAAPERGSF